MIAIYQITDAAPFEGIKAKRDMFFGFTKFKEDYLQYYTKVYEVDTDSLEQAFESTNLWKDQLVTKIKQGSSGSVGDIFVLDGNCYFCENYGWVALGKYEGFI